MDDGDVIRRAIGISQDADDIIKKQHERTVALLHSSFSHLPYRVVELALEQCGYEENEAALKLIDTKYLDSVGALRCIQPKKRHKDDDSYAGDSATDASSEEAEVDVEEEEQDNTERVKRKPNIKFLPLADALKDTTGMEGWSDARKEAWQKKKKNQNAYYYRFNRDGEVTRTGPWTSAEKSQFLARLNEFDLVGKGQYQWGLFSVPIVGRVGYQCSGFYRKLLKTGDVTDDNYYWEGGKLKFRKPEPRAPRPDAPVKSRRKVARDVSEENDEGQEYDPASRRDISKLGPVDDYINPLPGTLDPITQYPAFGPTGYVMDLATWKKCISEKGCCPFTRVACSLESVVLLTLDNIQEYKPKIINAV